MPLNTNIVGSSTEPLTQAVDARWIMAYSASLDDLNPQSMDTKAHTVSAHPVFPVCLEWPVILNTREMAGTHSLTAEESARGVHAAHDLHIYRQIRDGDELVTQATMIDIKGIKPGAAYTMRIDTKDAKSGDLICRTFQLGIYRGVGIEGEPDNCEEIPSLPQIDAGGETERHEIYVPGGLAHTYTECAHIWNPIHTDRAVALSAGLPDIILHGTATLALAVSKLVNTYLDGASDRVVRLGGRFAAMVLMPSTITLEARQAGSGTLAYEVLTEDGQTAISNGFLVYS